MDAGYTGKMIAQLRKEKGLTQKDLASRLGVTDKAVSKWERGINFPDIVLFEPLAKELDTTVLSLLGLEDGTKEVVADTFAEISKEEKERIRKGIRISGWGIAIRGIILLIAAIWASKILADHNLYGLPQVLTLGMIGFISSIVSDGIYMIRKSKYL